MKWLKRILFSIVALITLVALVIAFENWRGKRAWMKFKAEWEAKGERFDLASVIPPKVPDHENFAMTPFFAPLFDYEYAPYLVEKDSNAVLRTQAVSLGSNKDLPKMGARHNGERTRLKEWQEYFADDTSSTASTQTAGTDVLQALSKYEDVINELRAASARPHSRYPVHYHESISARLPHLPVLRSVSDIVRLRAAANLGSGRTNEAFADLKLALYLSESLKSEPLLISQLVRLSLLQSGLNSVWETLDRWRDDQLVELQETLARIDVLEDYPKALRGERAFSNDVFARMRSGGHFGPDYDAIVRFAPSGLLYQNQLSVNRLHQQYSFAAVDIRTRRVHHDKAMQMDEIPELKGRHPYQLFARLLFPALSKAVFRVAKAQTDVNFAVVAVALERYRRAHQQYPARLEDMTPKFIDKIPHDLISGEALEYVRKAPDSFLLYAVGMDAEDNQGAEPRRVQGPDPNSDWRWQPAPTSGDLAHR